MHSPCDTHTHVCTHTHTHTHACTHILTHPRAHTHSHTHVHTHTHTRTQSYPHSQVAEGLGPAYIKIAQMLSTRVDFMPPVYLEELARLQDNVAPFSTMEAREVRVWVCGCVYVGGVCMCGCGCL